MAINVCRPICIVIGFIVAAVGLILGFYVFPILVTKKIDETVILVNGTEGYERWETLPIPLFFKVYFFNVTNPDVVRNGGKPHVQEVGPYVYNQYRHKYNITKQGPVNVSYYQNQLFEFNQKASGKLKESDELTISNLALMGVIAIVDQRGGPFVMSLSKIINELFDEPDIFVTTTVHQFLFDGTQIRCDKAKTAGKNKQLFNRICNQIKEVNPAQLKLQPDGRYVFSLLDFKNNTHDGFYTVNNGQKNTDMLAEVLAWENSSTLGVWNAQNNNSAYCNAIYGTDTTIYPPHRTRSSKVNVFQSDICRSLELHYRKEIKYMGVAGLRYTMDGDVLNYSEHPENKCFCIKKTKGIVDENRCLYDGALELNNCQKVPVVMTFPHFYMAHKKYKDTVDGLTPDASLHTTFVDLEPSTGTVLRGSKRVQFNIFYKKVSLLKITDKLADTLMPVVWLDEGAELDENLINMLNDSFFNVLTILTAVQWTLFAIGMAMAVIGFIWCIFAN